MLGGGEFAIPPEWEDIDCIVSHLKQPLKKKKD
jgi:hypothetical protein